MQLTLVAMESLLHRRRGSCLTMFSEYRAMRSTFCTPLYGCMLSKLLGCLLRGSVFSGKNCRLNYQLTLLVCLHAFVCTIFAWIAESPQLARYFSLRSAEFWTRPSGGGYVLRRRHAMIKPQGRGRDDGGIWEYATFESS
jgi:hypothetical protein